MRRHAGGHAAGADRRGAARAGRAPGHACPRSPTTRPMPAPPRRSTSTAWCASTTCARGGEVGDLQVNLVDKHHRDDARATRSRMRVRPALQAIGEALRRQRQGGRSAAGPAGAVADRRRDLRARGRAAARAGRQGGARGVREDRRASSTSTTAASPRRRAALLLVDRRKAAHAGRAAAGHRDDAARRPGRRATPPTCTTPSKYPRRGRAAAAGRERQGDLDALLQLSVRSADRPAGADPRAGDGQPTRSASSRCYHKDLLPVNYVVADMAGSVDSPLYGMFAMRGDDRGDRRRPAAARWREHFISQPEDPCARLRAEVGRRVADHLRDLPRHGRRLRGRPGADLPAGGRAVRLAT